VQRGCSAGAARVTKHEGQPLGARAQRLGPAQRLERRRRRAEQRAEGRGRPLGALLRLRHGRRPLVEPGARVVERVRVGYRVRQ